MENSLLSHFVKLLSTALVGVMLVSCATTESSVETKLLAVPADSPQVEFSGRYKLKEDSGVVFGYSGSRVRLRFRGSSVGLWMEDEQNENYVMLWLDGEPVKKVLLNAENGYYELASGLAPGEHTVEVVRITECQFGLNTFKGFQLGGEDPKALDWEHENDRKIEFIGDSITCGYGVEVNDPNLHFSAESENFCWSYSGIAARELDADYLVVSRSGIGMVRNYNGPFDGSDNTMPQLYSDTFYMRPESGVWDYKKFIPNVVCINLGTNDFSTTGVNVENYVSAYTEFTKMLLERYPDTEFVLIQGPMNNSEELGNALARVVSNLKQVSEDRVHFIELSAQGALGYGADYHPNIAQSKANAAELTEYLSELMAWD